MATKSLPRWRRPLAVVCYFAGHDNESDRPGWFDIVCRRCGKETPYEWFGRIKYFPYNVARKLVWLANRIEKRRNSWPGAYWPVYRRIEQQIPGIGTEHSCGCYSYEHIVSMLKQYEDDGLPEPKLSDLISEEGWINLEEHPEMIQPMLDDINKGVELLRTKEEQEELNRYDD